MGTSFLELLAENTIEQAVILAVDEASDFDGDGDSDINAAIKNDVSKAIGDVLSDAAESVIESTTNLKNSPTAEALDDFFEEAGKAATAYNVLIMY